MPLHGRALGAGNMGQLQPAFLSKQRQGSGRGGGDFGKQKTTLVPVFFLGDGFTMAVPPGARSARLRRH
jgi:hypothetical protein